MKASIPGRPELQQIDAESDFLSCLSAPSCEGTAVVDSHSNRDISVVKVTDGAGGQKGIPAQTLSSFFQQSKELLTCRGTVTCLAKVCLTGERVILSQFEKQTVLHDQSQRCKLPCVPGAEDSSLLSFEGSPELPVPDHTRLQICLREGRIWLSVSQNVPL